MEKNIDRTFNMMKYENVIQMTASVINRNENSLMKNKKSFKRRSQIENSREKWVVKL